MTQELDMLTGAVHHLNYLLKLELERRSRVVEVVRQMRQDLGEIEWILDRLEGLPEEE